MLRNEKQIVCISSSYYKDFLFRKQHFMSRFNKKGYKIAYIDPSFSMLRKHNILAREVCANSFLRTKVEKIDDNFFLIIPPRYLPFYFTRPVIRKLYHLYVFSRISSILEKLGFNNYILWVYKPYHVDILRFFKHKKLVFDIADDLSVLYGRNGNEYRYLEKYTKSLVLKSNMVLVTAYTLFEKYKKYSKNIHLVPNGYDENLFSDIKNISDIPTEIEDIEPPVIGFVGTLWSYYDYNLLRYIIEKNSDKSFVFVGPCSKSIRRTWEEIIKYNNVIWLRSRKREEIPAIINKFDVCINPFKVDEVSKSVSPLKVFEYLAMKKPVVSVRMESLKRERISKLIYFAKDYDEFNQKLNFALINSTPNSEYQCIKEYSWDSLFNKVFDLIERFY